MQHALLHALAKQGLKLEALARDHGGLPEVPLLEGAELVAQRQAVLAVLLDVDATHLKAQRAHLVVAIIIARHAGHPRHAREHGVSRGVHELAGKNSTRTLDRHDLDGLDAPLANVSRNEGRVVENLAASLKKHALADLGERLRREPDVAHEIAVLPGGDAKVVEATLDFPQIVAVRYARVHHGRHERVRRGATQGRGLLDHQHAVLLAGGTYRRPAVPPPTTTVSHSPRTGTSAEPNLWTLIISPIKGVP